MQQENVFHHFVVKRVNFVGWSKSPSKFFVCLAISEIYVLCEYLTKAIPT